MWMYHYTKYIVTDRTGLLCIFFSYFATVCGIYKRDINLAYTYIPEQDNSWKMTVVYCDKNTWWDMLVVGVMRKGINVWAW